MAVPTNRADFIKYCLRRLGAPIIKINVSPDQLDDRVDEALAYFNDYHFDGVEKIYYKYPITQTDVDNEYITLPDNILGAVNLFPIGLSSTTSDIFNIRYQIALNDLYTLTSVSMVPYVMAMSNVQFLEQVLVGQQPFRYNRFNRQFHIDTDWTTLDIGEYLIVEAYSVVDPDTYTAIWGDLWLQKYATCIIKQQWGSVLKLYQGLKMPGDISFNGQQIYDEATEERKELEKEMISNFGLPVTDLIA
jgi:hypothetical protein